MGRGRVDRHDGEPGEQLDLRGVTVGVVASAIVGGVTTTDGSAPDLEVPDLVRRRAMSNGGAGRRWLDDLPDVVATLADRWGLDVSHALDGGTASLVVAAADRTGRRCVLKVAMPLDMDTGDSFARSVAVHRLAGGRGCAELLAVDDDVPAMLLERLGPNLHDLGMAVPEVLRTIATTLRTFWRPVPEDCGLPSGADGAEWLRGHIVTTWEALARPCDRAVVDRALACCDERAAAFDPSVAVLVHGDAHGWNTLQAGPATHKLVDPEGLRSEPAHDLSVPMREYNEPLLDGDTPRLVRERAEVLAALCDLDPEPVWQWGYIERVSTGLTSMRELGGGEGSDFLEVAARCLRS